MLSNLFVPKSTRQFLLRPVEELKFEKNNRVNFWTTSPIDAKLPIGLWDGCKINSDYKKLLEILEVNNISNDKVISMFQNAITQSTKYDIQKEILQGLDSFQPNSHMEREIKVHQQVR